jgi:hypothetical protein
MAADVRDCCENATLNIANAPTQSRCDEPRSDAFRDFTIAAFANCERAEG